MTKWLNDILINLTRILERPVLKHTVRNQTPLTSCYFSEGHFREKILANKYTGLFESGVQFETSVWTVRAFQFAMALVYYVVKLSKTFLILILCFALQMVPLVSSGEDY